MCGGVTTNADAGTRLELALQAAAMGSFDWDMTTGEVIWDERLCEIFGVAPEEFDGRIETFFARIHPDDVPVVERAVAEAVVRCGEYAAEYRVLVGPTDVRWVDARGCALPGPDGTAVRLMGVALDVTERRTTKDTIARTLEHMADAFVALDHDGRVTYVNQAAEGLLGLRRDTSVGANIGAAAALLDADLHRLLMAAESTRTPQSDDVFLAGLGRWLHVRAFPGPDGLTIYATDVTERRDAAAERAFGRAGLPSRPEQARLVQVYTEALAEAVTVDDVTDVITRLVMPAFGAAGVLVYLADSGRLRLVGSAGYTPDAVRRLDGQPIDGAAPVAEVLRTRVPLFVTTLEEYERRYPQRSEFSTLTHKQAWAFLPLLVPGRPLGTLTISFEEPREFVASDRAVLLSLAGFLAQCLERARLHDNEHELATALQRGLLPALLPTIEGVTSEGRYLPATEGIAVGGDWYDVIALPTGGVGMVVGDVQGHSVAAAALMGQLRHALRAYAAEGHDPVTVVGRTNRFLCDLDSGLFATCCYICVDVANGMAHVVRAGHPQPLRQSPDGPVELLDIEGGLPLGIDPEQVYPETVVPLISGDVLLSYTDGLVESRAVDLGAGTQRLVVAASSLRKELGPDLSTLADHLVALSLDDGHRSDDVAVVLLRYDGLTPEQRPLHADFAIDAGDFSGPARARVFLRMTLQAWDAMAVADAALLLTTEIVTNALRHGDGHVALTIRRTGPRIRVEVSDGDLRQPKLVDAASTDTGGRGMHIVATLAQAWGTRPQGAGKTVWFDLDLPEEPA